MKRLVVLVLLLALAWPVCGADHPAPWAQSAVLYELNTRQFTPQGTFQRCCRTSPS